MMSFKFFVAHNELYIMKGDGYYILREVGGSYLGCFETRAEATRAKELLEGDNQKGASMWVSPKGDKVVIYAIPHSRSRVKGSWKVTIINGHIENIELKKGG